MPTLMITPFCICTSFTSFGLLFRVRIDCIVQCLYNCAIEVPIVHTKQCRTRKYSSFFSAENYKHSILTTMIMVCMFAKKLGIAQPLSRVSKVMCLNKPAAGLCTGACV